MYAMKALSPYFRTMQSVPPKAASSPKVVKLNQGNPEGTNHLDFFKSVGNEAVEYMHPASEWLENLKKTNLGMPESSFDPSTGAITLDKKFAWIFPAFRFVHVMSNANNQKAWIIPVQGTVTDAGQDGMVRLALTGKNKEKYDALKSSGYSSKGVWLQRRTGPETPAIKVLRQLGTPQDPESWTKEYPFFELLSNWIDHDVKNGFPSAITPGPVGGQHVLYFSMPTSDKEANKNRKPLLLRVRVSKNNTIQEISPPLDQDWIDMFFTKLPTCRKMWNTLTSIQGMTAKIDYNASEDVNSPIDNKLILNPKLSRRGARYAFLSIMWHIAFHLLWHGDDPFTPFKQEKAKPLHEDILNTTFEEFKKKYHTALGSASFCVLNIPHLSVTNSHNMELLPLLQESLNTCFTTDDGKNKLGDVKKYWLSGEPEKLGEIFDPNDANAKKLYNKLQENASKSTPAKRSWGPPLNSPSLQRSPLQELRLAIATLNVKTVRELVDFIEYIDRKGEEGNDRFGLYGVEQLSQLSLDSALWNSMAPIRPEYRQMIKDMAGRIVDSKYKSLMDGVHGGDGIFDAGELNDWLSKHHRDGAEPDSTAFHTFYTSVQELNEKAVGIMDWLEWHDDPKNADPDNGRYGMRGVQLLSLLTPASEEWEASGSGHLDNASRQSLIDKAKVLMNPDYALWTFQMHEGDMIFERDDMKNWLADNRV